jgi:DNA (cytosine-5)-methyltransferase 1
MIRVFDMFAGYGGAEFALTKAGIEHECVGFSEIDKYAIQCFQQNHKGKCYGDCTKINTDELPDFDLLCGGFPCQDVSIAGKRDLTKGRTNLYKEVLRIAEAKKPKYMLLENVKGLLSIGKDRNLRDIIINDLQKIGYGVAFKCLNSKDFGIPQSRARVWFVCKLGGWTFGEFKWPQEEKLNLFIKDILEEQVADKFYLSKEQTERLLNKSERNLKERFIDKEYSQTLCARDYKDPKIICLNNEDRETNRVYLDNGISPTLNTMQGGNRQPKICAIRQRDRHNNNEERFQQLEQRTDSCSNTITTVQKDNVVIFNPYSDTIKSDGSCGTLGTGRGSTTNKTAQLVIHNLQKRDINRPSIQNAIKEGKPVPGGSGHLIKEDGTTYCIDTANTQAIEYNQVIRKLTPKECFRLMGFVNDEINLDGISDSQQYKLAGNGWEIGIVTKIFKQMFKDELQKDI